MIEKELALIRKDVDEIKTAIIGNSYNEKHSIINRLEAVESKVKNFETLKNKAYGVLFGVSFLVSLIWNAILNLIKN